MSKIYLSANSKMGILHIHIIFSIKTLLKQYLFHLLSSTSKWTLGQISFCSNLDYTIGRQPTEHFEHTALTKNPMKVQQLLAINTTCPHTSRDFFYLFNFRHLTLAKFFLRTTMTLITPSVSQHQATLTFFLDNQHNACLFAYINL